MADKVYYYNRNGILKLTVGQEPYYMLRDSGEFKNHSWGYEQQYGTLRGFHRDKFSYPFSIIVKSNNLADFDALCDIFNEDVIAGKQGYLLINGWRLDCYVIKAEHKFYGLKDNVISFEAVSVNSTWTRTSFRHFDGGPGGGGGDYGRNYSYTNSILGREYKYGYEGDSSHSASITLRGTDNGFEAMIYGPATNPTIYINNDPVTVNVTIGATERLRIVSNGPTKTIDILQADGSSTSAFVYRDKTHSPFLTLGENNELTFGNIVFDFTSIERRSEPSWT